MIASLALVGSPSSQAFVLADDNIPHDNGSVGDVELQDVDLDGDWDVARGEGYDDFGGKNSLWINQGGLQGSIEGVFADESAARIPLQQEITFDLAFGDIDADGDPDLHISNSFSSLSPGGSRWWINVGLLQGGTVGYFEDQSAARWVGLGMPGSSVPPQLFSGGTFWDDCHSSELADIDSDGDLDLVHSSYLWGAPNQPARLFLNDGAGYFSELNPSGFMPVSAGGIIFPGDPGLWCDGLYDDQTADTTGAFCDPTTVAWDADVGDIDGDSDLDLVFSDDYADPGFFANRLEASVLAPAASGAQTFRDVSGGVIAPGYAGTEENCQELGDLDGDGDLDLVGGTYLWFGGASVSDCVFEWDGAAYQFRTALPSSAGLSAELFDYDHDGDLDFLSSGPTVALHSNDGGFAFTAIPVPSIGMWKAWDADVADVDGDGDLDILVGMQGGQFDHLLLNTSGVHDAFAPDPKSVESMPDGTASAASRPVRVRIFDNAPVDVSAHNPTQLRLEVDGVELPPVQARWSGGRLFRAELPGNLLGQVAYRFRSTDEAGNTGSSAQLAYASAYAGAFQSPYGAPTVGSSGGAPLLQALSVPFAQSTVYLALSSGAPAGTPTVIGVGTQPLDPAVSIPGLLTLRIAGQVLAAVPGELDAGGDSVLAAPLGAVPAGVTVFAQGFVFDTTVGGQAFASSNGLAVSTQ